MEPLLSFLQAPSIGPAIAIWIWIRRFCGTVDAHFGSEEMEGGEDESRAEFACPFCCEDFDVVGLCFHIDEEHPVEAKNGVCPVCAARVGTDMVAHTTTVHANIFKIQCRRRLRKVSAGSHFIHSLQRKDLHEDNFQSLLRGSFAASNAAPDPLLSSFIFNLHAVDTSDGQPEALAEETFAGKVSDEKSVESAVPAPSHSDKNLEESTRRSEFVRQLVLSTTFDDNA